MTTDDPYTSSSERYRHSPPVVPPDILKKIKHAWIAAVISGSITLIFTVIAISGTDVLGASAWTFLDVALIFGLAFGIFKKSRTCAVIMLTYFVLSKVSISIETGKLNGLGLGILFAYFYWEGVSGTFAYHKFNSRHPTNP
jgi:serine/threonine-protein kinase